MGSIVSAIGRGINAIVSAIAAVIETIVSAIVGVIASIFYCIEDILCCRCCSGRSRAARSSGTSMGFGRRRRAGGMGTGGGVY